MPARWPTSETEVSQLPRWPTGELQRVLRERRLNAGKIAGGNQTQYGRAVPSFHCFLPE